MNGDQFKEFGSEMMNYITNYLDNIRDRTVLPAVEPGYMRHLLPTEAPVEGESWKNIMADLDRVIMPGITHWQSPQFHAYFPAANSYPSVVAEMLSAALGCIGFTWIASPAYTELEIIMMDWLGKMLGLPDQFLTKESGCIGGGVIQGSASESTLLMLISARTRTVKKYLQNNPHMSEAEIIGKLVAYSSVQSHSSVEKAGVLSGVKMRLLNTDSEWSLRGDILKEAVDEDIANGLIPFYVVGTLGTTGSLAFDNLDELGDVAKEYGLWLHVDAAYAGAAFICEEFRYLMKGVEKTDSFNFNPCKWLLINHDCSALWLKKTSEVADALALDPVYLKHNMQDRAMDFRNLQVPLGRRFRSLKLWFVMRIYGVKQMQEPIRLHVKMAKEFEAHVRSDDRFEVVTPVIMGLVCFRLRGASNAVNEELLTSINQRRKIHMVPAKLGDTLIIRFAICSQFITSEDIKYAWDEIQEVTDLLQQSNKNHLGLFENHTVVSRVAAERIGYQH